MPADAAAGQWRLAVRYRFAMRAPAIVLLESRANMDRQKAARNCLAAK